MPHTLKLMADNASGETTISLSGGTDALLLDYEPSTPSVTTRGPVPGAGSVTMQDQSYWTLSDGGELPGATLRNVTESARVMLVSSSTSALQGVIRNIEQWFRQAERVQNGSPEARIFVKLQMTSDAAEWRSEILTGRLQLNDDVLENWANVQADVILSWTRRYYWEYSTQTVTMTNQHGSAASVSIYNHSDSAHDNFVDIAASSTSGAIPSPAYIRMTNYASAAINLRNIYICQNVVSTPSSFGHILEGEASIASGTTSVGTGTCSNDNYMDVTWASSTTHASALYNWTLSATSVGYAAGNYFRVLARFAAPPSTDTYVKVALMFPSVTALTTLQETAEVQLAATTQLQDLGVLQIPPRPPYVTITGTNAALALVITARDSTGGSLDIDFVQLSPLDGWRHIVQPAYQLGDQEAVIDDGPLGVVYSSDVTSANFYMHIGHGEQIRLRPGVKQRLYFLWDETTSDISREIYLTLAYRPRRLTL